MKREKGGSADDVGVKRITTSIFEPWLSIIFLLFSSYEYFLVLEWSVLAQEEVDCDWR